MSTKAQIQGQVFIFLLALVIIAAVLLLGYKGMKMISDQGERAELDRFRNAVIRDVEQYQNYGSMSQTVQYKLPLSVDFVCFLELGAYNSNHEICDSSDSNYQALACDSWQHSTASVFIIPPKEFELKIKNLDVQNNAFCLKPSFGSIKVKYEGLGDKTLVKKA